MTLEGGTFSRNVSWIIIQTCRSLLILEAGGREAKCFPQLSCHTFACLPPDLVTAPLSLSGFLAFLFPGRTVTRGYLFPNSCSASSAASSTSCNSEIAASSFRATPRFF